MTKDEQIANLRASIAELKEDKRVLVETLQLAMGPRPVAASTERTRRYRERHGNVPVTDSGTSRERFSDVRGDYRGDNVPSSSRSTELTFPEPNNPVEATTPEEVQGKPKRSRDVPDTDWLTFRDTYPKTDRTSWPKALGYWQRLSLADRAAALAGCHILAANPPEPEYIAAAQRWLYERRWETVADRPTNGNGHKHGAVSEVDTWLAKQGRGPMVDVIDVTPL